VSATWPDAQGRFTLVLPHLAKGTPLDFWENDFVTFASTTARPGGAVDLHAWPKALSIRTATGFSRLTVGG
jgi:hypothetical protein